MHLDPNEAVTTTHGSTGPRTEAGKARSAQNAIRTGLYAARDFVRPGEEEEYAQTLIQLMDELAPEGTLEETFATEIMGANWRLRRCRLVEESFGAIDTLDLDPMIDEQTEKAQKSVDRARSQAHSILRRSMAELRKLQTERTIRSQRGDANLPGLADIKQVLSALKLQDKGPRSNDDPETAGGPPNMDALMALADKQLARQYREGGIGSFCKTAAAATASGNMTPRGAQCPCGSGMKFKRCCGKDAPPVLHRAA
jgi:hypothetical protein